MPEAIHGKKIVYLYRLLSEAAQKTAAYVAFTTENSVTYSRDADSVATKDGNIRVPGAVEIEVSTTALLAKGDEMIGKLKDALVNGELVEVWKVNMDEPGTGSNKFKATYFQGYVTEFEESATAEDHVECSLSFGMNGKGADGEATITEQQQALIEEYGFTDTTAKGA